MDVDVDDRSAPDKSQGEAQAEKEQLRVIANHLHEYYSANSFLAALDEARSLSPDGELKHARLWYLVAEELRRIEARARHEAK